MKPVKSNDVRRRFRDLVDDVEIRGEHVTIMRYSRAAAVIVPIEWYEQTLKALAAESATKSAE